MQIRESSEDYLEAILMLQKANGKARSIDIATQLGYSKPSVSIAMKKLRENGYITVADDGALELTETGMEIAIRMYERHLLLSGWLISLGVEEKTALDDACRIEHDISEESFIAIKNHILSHRKEELK